RVDKAVGILILLVALFTWCRGARAAGSLSILPTNIVLCGQAARQLLIVETSRNRQFSGELTNQIEWTSSNPGVVRIEKGYAIPVTNGTATLRARAGKAEALA